MIKLLEATTSLDYEGVLVDITRLTNARDVFVANDGSSYQIIEGAQYLDDDDLDDLKAAIVALAESKERILYAEIRRDLGL